MRAFRYQIGTNTIRLTERYTTDNILQQKSEDSMAKITISRLFEISQYLTTQAGQELQGALSYLSEFAEVTLRNLRNNLTFADNMSCEIKIVSVLNNTETVVSLQSNRRPVQVLVRRSFNNTYYVIDQFGWKFNGTGQIVVKAVFSGSPSATLSIDLDLVFIFG
jgi:hypothetical protein